MARVWKLERSFAVVLYRILHATFVIVALSADAEATYFYDFEEAGTGDVLATLELSNLPATFRDFNTLTFTPEGEAIFGLGPIYQGSIEWQAGGLGSVVSSDNAGGLIADSEFGVAWFDLFPPYAAVPPDGSPPGYFAIQFGVRNVGSSRDGLGIFDSNFLGIFIDGTFRIVPEPTSIYLSGLAFLAAANLRMRRLRAFCA